MSAITDISVSIWMAAHSAGTAGPARVGSGAGFDLHKLEILQIICFAIALLL